MGAKVASSGGKKRGQYAANGEMNVIPFIDILLVLLIIFMVAAPIPTVDVKVDLPPPVPPPETQEEEKQPVIVDIGNSGAGGAVIFVDGRPSTVDSLTNDVLAAIQVKVPDSPNRLLEQVRVRADQTLSYAEVMAPMAKLQESQFQSVSLLAQEAISEAEANQ